MPIAALDLRGHGESDWDPLQRYTSETHAADAAAVIEAMGSRDIVLVGHSLGAEVAAHVAGTHRDRVLAVVIVDGGPDLSSQASQQLSSQWRAQQRHYSSPLEYAAQLQEQLTLAEPEVLAEFAAAALRPCLPQGYELKRDPVFRPSRPERPSIAWTWLTEIPCPVLVVRGAVSAVLSTAEAVRLSQRLRDGRLATVRRAGHAVMLDNPAGFHAAVAPFLANVLHVPQAVGPAPEPPLPPPIPVVAREEDDEHRDAFCPRS